MSPVHVIVGQDQRAEAMWAGAFQGAIDLYRFDRNVDAFERLTVAEASIDLVILTPAQRGPFNLTPDQFIARVLEGPLGAGRFLTNLHIIVVGEPVSSNHPRVMSVSTLDAAIRLVKFGEIERAPRGIVSELPTAASASTASSSSVDRELDAIIDGSFSGSVISRIWDEPATEPIAPQRDIVVGGGGLPTTDEHRRGGDRRATTAPAAGFKEPGAPDLPAFEVPSATASTQLFSRALAPGFVVAQPQPIAGGGGEPMQLGAPGESIEVHTGALQPARQYELPTQAGYRGPDLRAGQVHGAVHSGGQPVPPALASQVQTLVYGNSGAVNDPLLVWSQGSRAEEASQAVPVPVPMQAPQPAHAVRTVPMEPPTGVYGAAPAAAMPQAQADPFLRRAEQGGGDVSFG